MPVPVIDLQRRLTIVGAIRAGGEKQPNRPGAKLEAFRLTSPRRELIEQAAALYGGEVSPWESPVGNEWQTYTTAEELPVLVMPNYSLRQTYELWEGPTKRLRLCDGIDEELSGGPCICNAAGVDDCDIYTRLVVALQELDTVLGWRLITKGANAAHELPTMLALLEAQAGGATFVPARIRIDQRRGSKDGQVVRYVVPTLDLGIGYAALAARTNGPAALPPGSPVVPETPAQVSPRRAAAVLEPPGPIPQAAPGAKPSMGTRIPPPTGAPPVPVGPETGGSDLPVADPAPGAREAPTRSDERPEAPYSETRQTRLRTDAQKSALDALVGKLRRGGHLTTEDLWLSMTRLRPGIDVAALMDSLEGVRDEDGSLHWSPMRDVLTRPEASQLIEWLQIKERRVMEADNGPDTV